MGTETAIYSQCDIMIIEKQVKLNNPLMGTETSYKLGALRRSGIIMLN